MRVRFSRTGRTGTGGGCAGRRAGGGCHLRRRRRDACAPLSGQECYDAYKTAWTEAISCFGKGTACGKKESDTVCYFGDDMYRTTSVNGSTIITSVGLDGQSACWSTNHIGSTPVSWNFPGATFHLTDNELTCNATKTKAVFKDVATARTCIDAPIAGKFCTSGCGS